MQTQICSSHHHLFECDPLLRKWQCWCSHTSPHHHFAWNCPRRDISARVPVGQNTAQSWGASRGPQQPTPLAGGGASSDTNPSDGRRALAACTRNANPGWTCIHLMLTLQTGFSENYLNTCIVPPIMILLFTVQQLPLYFNSCMSEGKLSWIIVLIIVKKVFKSSFSFWKICNNTHFFPHFEK